MSVLQLMKKLGGEVLANKVRANVNGKVVIIGRLINGEWEPTAEGAALEAELNAKPPTKAPAKQTAGGKAGDTDDSKAE